MRGSTQDLEESQLVAAFFSLYVAIIFLISAIAFPGFKPYNSNKNVKLEGMNNFLKCKQ